MKSIKEKIKVTYDFAAAWGKFVSEVKKKRKRKKKENKSNKLSEREFDIMVQIHFREATLKHHRFI